ncbi:MAG: helix-turn-helix transcriptional regulator [Clostridiales bacterium]|nr:helix-turn-helix transcriptional regulator [Clostridiales bacterium]MBQ1572524.1 helix-turn-helix transcriptional regulator [Clostridiales bacterium]
MDKIVRDFGEFIREKRIARGLSQSEMAKLLDISQAAYSRYESGNRDPGLNMVRKISKILKFKPGEFFDNYRG